MERIVIFGATSGIARAAAEEFLRASEDVVLVGRSDAALQALAADLEVRTGRAAPWFRWDVLDFSGHARRWEELLAGGPIKGVLMAVGTAFPQREAEGDPGKIRTVFDTNLCGVALVLDFFANHFRARRSGFISCLSSVAGDRGRQSNFIYGASKAGLTVYLQGLRNRLHGSGVLVQTVKPGFVRTPMNPGSPDFLTVSASKAARDIVEAIRRKRDEIYTPFFWRPIMFLVKAVPEAVFKRLKL